MIRPGIVLYGCKPNPVQEITLDLKPVLALKARIVKLKQVPALTPVSYGGTYVTTRKTTIATIALGYGQGLPRRLSNKGHVLINGRKYGIAGRVTMDYIMADVGCIPEMAVGDEVVAIGCQGTECITPDEVAAACDTIGYEILCAVSPLIDRLYILNGDVIHHEPARAY
jgi:alanine racemase